MTVVNRIISGVTGFLVLFVAGAAFWLSFEALRHLVELVGIEPSMSWLYPAIIDGAIIVFSLSVLQASFNREKTRYAWSLVAIFTLLSMILNIVHAQATILARFLAAIPPIALFLSFELLMGQVRAIAVRIDSFISLEQLNTQIEEKKTELKALESDGASKTAKLGQKLKDLEEKRTAIKQELTALRKEKRTLESSDTGSTGHARQVRASKKREAVEQLVSYISHNPKASLSEMGEAIGRSKSTAGDYIGELKASGIIQKNGHGWKVNPPDVEVQNA